jgi:hypothetical protein
MGLMDFFELDIFGIMLLILILAVLVNMIFASHALSAGTSIVADKQSAPGATGTTGGDDSKVLQVIGYMDKGSLRDSDVVDLEEIYYSQPSLDVKRAKTLLSKRNGIDAVFSKIVPSTLLHLYALERESTDVGIATLKQNKAYLQQILGKLKKSPHPDIKSDDIETLIKTISDAVRDNPPISKIAKLKTDDLTLKMLVAEARKPTQSGDTRGCAAEIRICKNENDMLRAKIVRLQEDIRNRCPIIAITDERDLRRRIEELVREKERLQDRIRDLEGRAKTPAEKADCAEHIARIKELERDLKKCNDDFAKAIEARLDSIKVPPGDPGAPSGPPAL